MTEENPYKPSGEWTRKTEETDLTEEAVFFTRIRQNGVSSDYITFLLKGDRHHTLASNEIEEIFFEPTQGIICFFRFGTIHIEGRNLQELHGLLREKKVTEIREQCQKPELYFEKDSLFIQRIAYVSENLHRMQII
jgi:hypothetical protein